MNVAVAGRERAGGERFDDLPAAGWERAGGGAFDDLAGRGSGACRRGTGMTAPAAGRGQVGGGAR